MSCSTMSTARPVARADLPEPRHDLPRLLHAHASGRLVEQESFGRRASAMAISSSRWSPCPILPAGSCARLRDAGELQALVRTRGDLRERVPRPDGRGPAERPLRAQPHVLEHREVREDARDLHRPRDARPGPPRRRPPRHVRALPPDLAAARRKQPGEQVDAGRLAGAVGADECPELAGADREVDPVDGHQAAELSGQLARLERDLAHAAARLPCQARHTPASPRGKNRTMRISRMPTGICV